VIAQLDELIAAPQFPDLADSGQLVDQYVEELTTEERNVLQEKFRCAEFRWAEVERAKSQDQARKALAAFVRADPMPAVSATPTLACPHLLGIAPDGERDPDEEFLSDYGIAFVPRYRLKLDAEVKRDGFRNFMLLATRLPLFKLRSLEFRIVSHNVPEPFDVKWKVKNTGAEATRKGALRGQLHDDGGYRCRTESTLYWGNHYVECYAIKDGVCVAADHIEVPIGTKE